MNFHTFSQLLNFFSFRFFLVMVWKTLPKAVAVGFYEMNKFILI